MSAHKVLRFGTNENLGYCRTLVLGQFKEIGVQASTETIKPHHTVKFRDCRLTDDTRQRKYFE